jgi:hypothetical protein
MAGLLRRDFLARIGREGAVSTPDRTPVFFLLLAFVLFLSEEIVMGGDKVILPVLVYKYLR